MSQYICLATSAGWKAGRLSTNTAQSVDRLSTNKADHVIICIYVIWEKLNNIEPNYKTNTMLIKCKNKYHCIVFGSLSPLQIVLVTGIWMRDCGDTWLGNETLQVLQITIYLTTVNDCDLDSVTLKAYKVKDCGRNLRSDDCIWDVKLFFLASSALIGFCRSHKGKKEEICATKIR